jgi:hypothetical protein
MLFVLTVIWTSRIYAQEKQTIIGKLEDSKNNQPVAYATVVLINSSGSKIAGGSMSDDNGLFKIGPVIPGNYILKVSTIGFKPANKSIDVTNESVTDAGIISLQDTAIVLKELVIVGDRVKAGSERDRTVYNVTESISKAAYNGTDVLKLIPGIRMDLMQNITLEGSSDILIYVDGKERDKNYINQLDPQRIDKIEIISVPPSNYEGHLTGVINIILKKDRESGISGQILAEIPSSLSEVYIFPSYSLNYGFKKINLYTSYNGELTYLDQQEISSREFWNASDTNRISSIQYVKQKNWSHRFHYGFDYFPGERDQFNFYAFYNPYSRELDGNIESQISGMINSSWKAKKEDTDKNTGTFYSLYYKHNFNKKGSELITDISSYSLKSESRTDFIQADNGNDIAIQSNFVKPEQNILSIKIDFSTPFSNKLNFSTGVKSRIRISHDKLNGFEHREDIFALYGNISYKQEKFDFNTGSRVEKSVVNLSDSNTKNTCLAILPYVSLNYKLTSRQNLRLAYNRSVRRPDLYQLNPYMTVIDPYTVSAGNPLLRPQFTGNIFLEHSVRYKSNFLASRLYFSRTTMAINNLMIINSSGNFETRVHNLGNIDQFGLQLSGALKIRLLTLNPYVRVFGLNATANSLAESYSVINKHKAGLESGISVIATIKHDLALSLIMQYNSPVYKIQEKTFSDLSYFLQIEKTIKQKIKVGIGSAIPFAGSFTYQGSEINGPDFNSLYEGKVKLSMIPFWFKLGYQFSSGIKRNRIERSKEEIETLPKKGF